MKLIHLLRKVGLSYEKALFLIVVLICIGFGGIVPLQPFSRTQSSPQALSLENARITDALDQEKSILAKNTAIVAEQDSLLKTVASHDEINTLSLLQQESLVQNLSVLRVVTPSGLTFAVFPAINQRGSYITLTTNWGYAFSHGDTRVLTGPGVVTPLVMVAGHQLTYQHTTLGTLFGQRVLNSAYAQQFRTTYLPRNTEVAFFTSKDGIVGSTIDDTTTIKWLSTYLQDEIPSNDTLAPISTTKYISLHGIYYLAHILPLTKDSSIGGYIVVLEPSTHESIVVVFAALITLLLIVLESFVHHTILKHNWAAKHFLPLIFIALLLFFSVFIILIYRFNKTFTQIQPSPYVLYNSTIKVIPDSGIFSTNSEKTISIAVNTGAEYINAVDVLLHYDPKKVTITDVITTNSFCNQSLFLARAIDPTAGTIHISCLITTPGFSGANGIVADILTKPVQEDMFSLTFDDATRVLANDGLGTDVLRLATGGQYVATKNIDASTQIFSPTHPNTTRWYNSRNITFVWNQLPNTTYKYSLDTTNTPPNIFSTTTTDTTVSLVAPHDGIAYFHLQPIENGVAKPVQTYPVQIDTTPPEQPTITASATNVQKSDIVRINFSSNDPLSGLQKIFYAKIGDNLLLPTKPPLYIPTTTTGKIPVTIRAFDQAGNYSDNTITITVQ